MANENKTNIKTTTLYYTQNGVVVGKMYGGGRNVVAARDYSAPTKKELCEKIEAAFTSGSIDHDMQLDKVMAAGVQIVETEMLTYNGKTYTRSETTNYVVGDKELFNELVCEGIIVDDLNDDDCGCKCGCGECDD